MRKRLKIVSLLTALALLGGLLGGCGKSSRIETDSVAVQETTDPLLAEHQKQLEQLNSSYTKRLTSNSQGVEFHLYYDDTQSMLGFVEAANGQNTFVTMLDKSIDCAKGMLNNGFSALKAYTLVDEIPGDKKNQELNWTEVDIVGALQAQFLRSDFYTGSHTGHREGTLTHAGTGTKVGPLARLFLDGNDPFVKGTFTVVVTDLREPRDLIWMIWSMVCCLTGRQNRARRSASWAVSAITRENFRFRRTATAMQARTLLRLTTMMARRRIITLWRAQPSRWTSTLECCRTICRMKISFMQRLKNWPPRKENR